MVQKEKKEKKARPEFEGLSKKEGSNYRYYKVDLMLFRVMLGTCPDASIYNEHILKKAKDMIKRANKQAAKLTKELKKYAGVDLPENKGIAELTGIIRTYQELMGRKDDIPTELEELLNYAKEIAEDYEDMVKKGESQKATVFMRHKNGYPMLSSHMILGNLKENLRIITNNSAEEQKATKSKVAVGEMMALDAKVVEEFIQPMTEGGEIADIMRKPDGSADKFVGEVDPDAMLAPNEADGAKPAALICERPINFERMGVRQTAIALSEQLPVGSIFSFHLRCRALSPINNLLEELLDYGKNNGLGAWRGSGNKGAYYFVIQEVDYDPTPIPKGWR